MFFKEWFKFTHHCYLIWTETDTEQARESEKASFQLWDSKHRQTCESPASQPLHHLWPRDLEFSLVLLFVWSISHDPSRFNYSLLCKSQSSQDIHTHFLTYPKASPAFHCPLIYIRFFLESFRMNFKDLMPLKSIYQAGPELLRLLIGHHCLSCSHF